MNNQAENLPETTVGAMKVVTHAVQDTAAVWLESVAHPRYELPVESDLQERAPETGLPALGSLPPSAATALRKEADRSVRPALERLLAGGILAAPQYLDSVLTYMQSSVREYEQIPVNQHPVGDATVRLFLKAACRYWQDGVPLHLDLLVLDPIFQLHGQSGQALIAELQNWQQVWQETLAECPLPQLEDEDAGEAEEKPQGRTGHLFLQLSRLLAQIRAQEGFAQASSRIQALVHDTRDMPSRIARAQEIVASLSLGQTVAGISLQAAVRNVMDDALRRAQGLQGSRKLYPTGLQTLDRHIGGGLKGSELYLIAARPAMGKTVLAAQIAEYISQAQDLPCLLFSLEMNAEQTALRTLARWARVPASGLAQANLSREDWIRVQEAEMQVLPKLKVEFSTQTHTDAICAYARQKHAAGQCSLVVVDYLQLMDNPSLGAGRTRSEDVGYSSRKLKRLANELDIPVIALSQLNRDLERRLEKRPLLSDLRESSPCCPRR